MKFLARSPEILVLTSLLISFSCTPSGREHESSYRPPRMLITTDIGGDPDDTQSMIRLLLYANEVDICGIVASASGTPGELDSALVRTDLINELIGRYAEVHPNLLLHDEAYPHPDSLLKRVKPGNPERGMDFIGSGHDTPGSRWIEKQILIRDRGPLDICVWGGQTDLFQALWSLKDSLGEEKFSEVTGHIRIYNINDQDHIHTHFSAAFPGLFHVLGKAPEGMDKREGVYRGMYLGGAEDLTSREWIYEHVKEGHGPLGAAYPERTWTAPNPHSCLKEGDTPSWFYFLNPGLQDPWKPEFGGWGGRFKKDKGRYYIDAEDQVGDKRNARATVWRWRPYFQADFQARMDWCVASPDSANHAPQSVLEGYPGDGIIYIDYPGGEQVHLDASPSWDPDRDRLSFRWWVYADVSGLPAECCPEYQGAVLDFDPEAFPGSEIHLVLEVRDDGEPSLCQLRRIVLTEK